MVINFPVRSKARSFHATRLAKGLESKLIDKGVNAEKNVSRYAVSLKTTKGGV